MIHARANAVIGGIDLGPMLASLSLSMSVETLENTLGAVSARAYRPGRQSFAFSAAGFVDLANTKQTDAVVFTGRGGATPCSVAPLGASAGSIAYLFETTPHLYTPNGNVGQLLAFGVQAGEATSPLSRGLVLQAGAVLASGVGAAQTLGAVPAGGVLYAALHVLSVADPASTLTVTIESSSTSTFDTATTRATFPVTSAVGGLWLATPVSAPGVGDTFWRARWALSADAGSQVFSRTAFAWGTFAEGPGFSIVVTAGIAKAPAGVPAFSPTAFAPGVFATTV